MALTAADLPEIIADVEAGTSTSEFKLAATTAAALVAAGVAVLGHLGVDVSGGTQALAVSVIAAGLVVLSIVYTIARSYRKGTADKARAEAAAAMASAAAYANEATPLLTSGSITPAVAAFTGADAAPPAPADPAVTAPTA